MTAMPAATARSDLLRWLTVPPGPDRAATARLGGWLLVVAVFVDVLRPGAATIAVGVACTLFIAVLVRCGPLHGTRPLALAGLGVGFAWSAALRASPWLVPLDMLAAAGLVALACSTARGGSPLDLGPDDLARRLLRLVRNALLGPVWVAGPLRPRGRHVRGALPVVRGLLLAVPVVLLLGALLASADAVFASVVDLDVSPPEVGDHVVLVVLCWLAGSVLAAEAASPSIGHRDAAPRLLGPVEAATVLAGLVALFALFAGTQIVALAGGAAHVIETAGLTRAAYARSGFFQLLAVAALTLATLTAVRSTVREGPARADRVVRTLTFAAVALILVVVAVAISRLVLYVDAYGLSMLRLCTMLFAGWIGVVFAALAVAVAGVGAGRHWLLPFAAGTGLAILLALHAADPEAIVARHNLDHWERTGRLDMAYLTAELSEDAVPTLLAGADRLGPARRTQLLTRLCARDVPDTADPWSWNLSRARAAGALAEACPSGQGTGPR